MRRPDDLELDAEATSPVASIVLPVHTTIVQAASRAYTAVRLPVRLEVLIGWPGSGDSGHRTPSPAAGCAGEQPTAPPAHLGHRIYPTVAWAAVSPTLDQVAGELNVTRSQVYAFVRDRSLTAIKIGDRGQWRVERSRLEQYIGRLCELSQTSARDSTGSISINSH